MLNIEIAISMRVARCDRDRLLSRMATATDSPPRIACSLHARGRKQKTLNPSTPHKANADRTSSVADGLPREFDISGPETIRTSRVVAFSLRLHALPCLASTFLLDAAA